MKIGHDLASARMCPEKYILEIHARRVISAQNRFALWGSCLHAECLGRRAFSAQAHKVSRMDCICSPSNYHRVQEPAMSTIIKKENSPKHPSGLKRFIPALSWLPKYDRKWLSLDALAGLTLWGLVVPEAMAYAGIAGLPPQAGLYTLVVALIVYALLGTSRHLVVQATSATAALCHLTRKPIRPMRPPSFWWSAWSSWSPA
jgi:hypothetical protein